MKKLLSIFCFILCSAVAPAFADNVSTLNDSNFNDSIKGGVAVVDFSAVWCGPCKKYGPVFHKVATKHQGVKFAQVDVDQAPRIADQYHVDRLPTTILFKNGKEVKRVIGPQDEATLDRFAQSAP